MAKPMDVVITSVTATRVEYELTFDRTQKEHWQVEGESEFDLSQLQVGHRYKVWSEKRQCLRMNYRKQQTEYRLRHFWIAVLEEPLVQDKKKKPQPVVASLPLVDDGVLFQW